MIQLKSKSSTSHIDDVLRKSVITTGFEKLSNVPLNHRSEKNLRKERKQNRLKNKGDDWYNLPATKITPEVHKDLEVLQMRSAIDPKRFYKKNDLKSLPKYFQIGRVVDSPTDFYSSRIPKKERKRTIIEELMTDAAFKQYTKRKYQEILRSNPRRKNKLKKRNKRNR